MHTADLLRYGLWCGVAATAAGNRRAYRLTTAWLPHLLTNTVSLLLPDLLRLGRLRRRQATHPSLRLARHRLERREWVGAVWVGAALALVAVHSLYKQLFGIGSDGAFVGFGLAERTLWEALLIAGAAALWRLGQVRPGLTLLGVALAHSIIYTLLLHNPLWSEQAVGPLPLLNLIPLAYAVPVAVLLGLDRVPAIKEIIPERIFTLAWMMLVLLFTASVLRQLFHGSLLVEPGLDQAEDIARSIFAIALAIGFLLWGIRTSQRDWRIGSLVLMIGAVVKVFLWDT